MHTYIFVHYPTDKILKRNMMILINQFRIIQVYTVNQRTMFKTFAFTREII
jgi:hypothetical protein